jgi:hypothetical protein
MKNQKCKRCNQLIDDSIAIDLNLCQKCWEEVCDKDWWREVRKLKFRK